MANIMVTIALAFLSLLLLSSSSSSASVQPIHQVTHFNRTSFPPGFLFGAASAAYQYEGGAFEDGKGPSIWDTYTHQHPDKIADRSNGDVAADFYHRYKEDIKLMKSLGLEVFRMSISWSRILPRGKLSGGINKKGIAFYNNVFNELLANGITPFVTIFHWDIPQALEDDYSGFLSPLVVEDFKNFADLCFKEFGDRVKNWITVNEPFSFINTGYDSIFLASFAPGRCSYWANCTHGDSATEPYIVGHHLLLGHAAIVKLYREKYKPTQKGQIGMTFITYWFEPYDPKSALDAKAAQRALDFMYGWFADPIVFGDYPKSMRAIAKDRVPRFTTEQSAMLKGSYDFIGLNYYTANYAQHLTKRDGRVSSTSDIFARLTTDRKGVHIGKPTGVSIFYEYPKGLTDLLVYTKKRYNNPTIYITENGFGDLTNITTVDPLRADFYKVHFRAIEAAINQGVKVKGFMAWTLLDVFEWGSGYTQRFGLCYVDYEKGTLKRTPKQSALWYKSFLLKN